MQTKRTFFVTSTCHERRSVFRNQERAELFIQTLYHYREQQKLLLHAFVAMPDHIHLVLTPAWNLTLERAVQFVKGGFSHRAGGKLEIWQRGFEQHRIKDLLDYGHHVNYTHENPVRARLVTGAAEYPYSSANPRFEVDPMPEEFRG